MKSTPNAPRHACWLSQQAAEKALKAALVLERVEFPFTHDLDALRNLLRCGGITRRVRGPRDSQLRNGGI